MHVFRSPAFFLLALLAGHAFAATDVAAQAHLAILETTDLHSHVIGYDYDKLADDPHVGFDRVATLIEQARKEFPNTLLIDDGDTIQGTALADYQALSNRVPCKRELAIYRAMDLLHYDAGSIGNHEFNYGLPFLSQVTGTPMHLPDVPVEHCDGPNYPLALSNVVRADDNAPVFKPWLLLTREITVTNANGKTSKLPIRIGLLGFTPPPIMQWDHAHLTGKVKALGVVEAAKRFLPELQAQHPDIVIAVVHGGLDTAPYTPTMENADWYLAAIPGIDVVLMGHSHDVFPNPSDPKSRLNGLKEVDNLRGFARGKPAVMGGFYGHDLGVIDLALKYTNGKWAIDAANTHSEVRPTCKSKDRCVAPDPRIAKTIAPVQAATIKYVQTPIGQTDFRISTYFSAIGDSTAAAVINAAQIAYAKQHLFDAHPELRGLPMLSAASAFKTGFAGPDDYTDIPPGPLSIRSAADLYTYPNTLTVVKLDGAGVKAWLEKSAEYFNRIDPDATQSQLLLNRKFASYNFDVLMGEPQDGFHYDIDLGKPVEQRIVDLVFRGKPLDPQQQFLVVTNNYRAEGGGHFPGLDGSKTIWAAPDTNRDAVVDYVRARKTLHRSDFDVHPWKFVPLHAKAPLTFECAAGKLDIARAAGIDDVTQSAGNGDGTATCSIDLSKR
ncbi:MAG TPA: bifunctional 2',3'-cyclic-nucleotide 2'-phosphodiesterase/3'-nucleotidase [Rhodanobacteraceae bacterium]|nr:bifunctional 2',3'-cyclic-nucleotide 2'-phosphodiesterase/3'-nucleotidase [Rhodanobacteraceae bacterium]